MEERAQDFFSICLGGSLQRWVAQIPSFGIVEVDQFFLPLLFEETTFDYTFISMNRGSWFFWYWYSIVVTCTCFFLFLGTYIYIILND